MAGNYTPKYTKTEEWTNTGTRDIMVFHPTIEEMSDFSAYIQKCESQGAVKASGICKIVPPKEWSPRPNLDPDYNDALEYVIKSPVREKIVKVKGQTGAFFKQNMVFRRELSVGRFRERAISAKYSNPNSEASLKELEKYYWKNISFCETQPIYGADTPGSLYEDDVNEFNMSKLGTILDLLKDDGYNIPGVTSPYLYFGMWKTAFAWHIEDCDLYSINYLHYGEPKFWYAVPPSEASRVEDLFASKFPVESNACPAYLRHKTFILDIQQFVDKKIPYGTMVQYPREFIITFPQGFHFGFNVGYNCAESTNFALDRWIDLGKNASVCKCTPGAVEVPMISFMKKYRINDYPEWYKYWYGCYPPDHPSNRQLKSELPNPELPVVDLPPIENAIFDSFNEKLEEARTDYNFLWHHQTDFKEELQYNKTQKSQFPYCCICQYFVPQNEKMDKPDARTESVRYTTDQLYEKSESKNTTLKLKESRLVQCRRCFVMVHADCLNLGQLDLNTSNETESLEPSPTKRRKLNWTCKRCEFAREELICAAIQCAFCPLRGGALVPHNPESQIGEFVHVVCAIMSRRTKLIRTENSIYAKSLNEDWLDALNQLIPPWQELGLNKNYLVNDFDLFLNLEKPEKCGLCKLAIRKNFIRCHDCYNIDEKPIYFHASCSYYAHIVFEHRNFPSLAVGICPCHSQQTMDTETKLKIGEKVVHYAQDGNRIELVKVLRTTESQFCHVEFFDQTFSLDVCPKDIVDCECKRIECNGQHVPGWIVIVCWEESLFQGYVRQIKSDVGYIVESLTTKENIICSRNAIYRLDQEMPTNVASAIQKWSSNR